MGFASEENWPTWKQIQQNRFARERTKKNDQPSVVNPETHKLPIDASTQFETFQNSIKSRVEELERAEQQLGMINATILMNFGPDGRAGKNAGIVIDKPDTDTFKLFFALMEQVVNRISELEKKANEPRNAD